MRERVREFLKRLSRLVLGDYAAYYVYASPLEVKPAAQSEANSELGIHEVDRVSIQSSPEPLIREQIGYTGSESRAYACFIGDRIVAVCIYWFGKRYLQRNFWPLRADEAKLVQIVSLPEIRGRGVATALIKASCHDMMLNGFRKTYARIWHSNTPSLRAFERAGWARIALVVEVNPLRRPRPIRLQLRSRPRRSHD